MKLYTPKVDGWGYDRKRHSRHRDLRGPCLQHSGLDGPDKDIAFCGVRMVLAGSEKLKIVQERKVDDGRAVQTLFFSLLYLCFTHLLSLSTFQLVRLMADDMYLLGKLPWCQTWQTVGSEHEISNTHFSALGNSP